MPLSKSHYKKYASEFLHQWEQRLNAYEAQTLAKQVLEWKRLGSMFDALIAELTDKTNLSENQIYKLAEYKKFRDQTKTIMEQYARFNVNITRVAQRDFGQAGLTTSNTLLRLINPNFSRLPVEAINKMIGTTSEGSPLYKVLIKRFDEHANKASDILIEGIARGLNPNTVARDMRKQLDISVYDSTRITRTEALNVYRDISYNQYVESGLVDSYLWIAESNACDECLEMEANSPYPLDSVPSSLHPFDRCTIAPNI